MPRRPLDALEESLGEEVIVLLKDDTRYAGRLAGFDQHMNVVLEDAAVEPGEGDDSGEGPDGDDDDEPGEDTIVIRGDNVVSIVP